MKELGEYISVVCRVAAAAFAVAALVKMAGIAQFRVGTMELAVVGILCALVSK